MALSSTIEWTDATWNPVTGCTQVSAGCDHCYALAFAERFRGVPGHPYEQGFDLRLWPGLFLWLTFLGKTTTIPYHKTFAFNLFVSHGFHPFWFQCRNFWQLC